MNWRWLACAAMLAFVGCEKESGPPPEAYLPQRPARVPTQPTTAQILSEPRENLTLSPWPLKILAPRSWKVQAEGVTLLHGPAPHGAISIMLSRQMLSRSTAEALLEKERKLAHPATASSLEHAFLEQSGPLHILNQRFLPKSGNSADPVDWRISLFVQQGPETAKYSMTFAGLTLGQLEKDHAFLEEIVRTLEYDPSGADLPPAPGTSLD